MDRPLTILSLGAGVQSSTLALMMARGDIQAPDAAIFADTMAEPKAVYTWLDWLEKMLPYPLYRVSKGDLLADSLRLRNSKKTGAAYLRTLIPFFVKKFTGGRQGMLLRKCTREYKIEPIVKKCRELVGPEQIKRWQKEERRRKKNGEPSQGPLMYQVIGISLDEWQRMKPSALPWIENVYPLVAMKFTRVDCVKWMQERGYREAPRSACIVCPYRSDKEWSHLTPEEVAEAAKFEQQQQQQQLERQIGTYWLHRSCQPIDQVKFDAEPDSQQLNMFNNECEGMCGN